MPPATGPDGVAFTSKDGVIEMEYRGELPALLAWLNANSPIDVRIEPLGLGPLYARIHGGVE
jgi:ABC-2 type transport system ATP-binding protein